MSERSLRITEIFYSLQGESRSVGVPTIFVRLTGCPLRCQYCDSEYAFFGGEKRSFEDIFAELEKYKCKVVCVTGGEPLAQPLCIDLLTALCDRGYEVSLETSGAIDIAAVDERVTVVMDLKTPDSGEQNRNRLENVPLLKKKDLVKFVVCSRKDYEWTKFKLDELQLTEKAEVLMSPCFGKVSPADLASWILEDQLSVRFQMQLHKQLWGDKPGV
ncbi:MAG: 7-carboxy-7-deazaguanine synthase QueE [Agarilytica sp.]